MTHSRTPTPPADAFARLGELIKDINFAMLSTIGPDGSLRSRPMGTQEIDLEHGLLWFFTAVVSPKVSEFAGDQEVGLTYAEPAKQKFVSISGRAHLVREATFARRRFSFDQRIDDRPPCRRTQRRTGGFRAIQERIEM